MNKFYPQKERLWIEKYFSVARKYFDLSNELKREEYKIGKLLLRFSFCTGVCGLEGSIGILVPPYNIHEIDASIIEEPSKYWDSWSYLAFMTIPITCDSTPNHKERFKIIFFWDRGNVYDAPSKIIRTITLNDEISYELTLAIHDQDSKEELDRAITHFIKIANEMFEAEVIEIQN